MKEKNYIHIIPITYHTLPTRNTGKQQTIIVIKKNNDTR